MPVTASQALSAAAESEALPKVEELSALYQYGFLPRRSQLLMVAGQPAAGKSTFTMWLAHRMGLRTLVFSADQDSHTSITRLAACITGYTVNSVMKGMESANGFGFFSDALASSRIQFCFDSSPTMEDIALELDAYVEMWDAYPEVIVIDNLVNVEAETAEDVGGLRLVMKELHAMSRYTGAAVIVVHHTLENDTPHLPQSRKDLYGKVGKLPERILTVASDPDEGSMRISVVKNRGGKQDPTGKTFFRLQSYPERASFGIYMGRNYSEGVR